MSQDRRQSPPASRTPWGLYALAAGRAEKFGRDLTWPSTQYQQDPVGFAREVLGIEPWSKQVEILEAVRDHKRVAVRSGHKCGKSNSAAILALWFYCSFTDARVVMTSVTARQVDAILFREVKKLRARAKRPIEGEAGELARTGIKASDFREIVGFTAREGEAVAGISGANILYLPDEASGIPDAIFEAIEGNRAGGARLAMFSNPTRTEGEFFEAFESKSAFYKCVHVSSEDTPNVVQGREVIPGLATREWVEEKRLEWGEDSPLFKVRVRGEFVRNEEGKIISLHLLEESEARWVETPDDGRLYIGLDPAGPGEGGDESVFAARRGQKALGLYPFRGLSEEAHLSHLLGIIKEHARTRELPPVVNLDRNGLGFKVYQVLRAHLDRPGHDHDFVLFGIDASAKACREPQIYALVRDELWANLRDWLRAGGAIPTDTKLSKELHAPSWVGQRVGGGIKATQKDELKKALGRSPDRGDALCLCVWEPMALQDGQPPMREPSRAAIEPYDQPEHKPTDRVFDPYGGVQ